MAHRGTVTLITPAAEKIVWNVVADPVVKDGVCTFMQEVDGKSTRIRIMGTVIVEIYDTLGDAPPDNS